MFHNFISAKSLAMSGKIAVEICMCMDFVVFFVLLYKLCFELLDLIREKAWNSLFEPSH